MPRRPERELLARLTDLAHPSAGQWALAHRMQAAGHDVVPLRPVLTRRDQALALDNNDLKIFVAYRDRAVVRTVELDDQRDVSLRRRCLLLFE